MHAVLAVLAGFGAALILGCLFDRDVTFDRGARAFGIGIGLALIGITVVFW